jgi:hypothetical protein
MHRMLDGRWMATLELEQGFHRYLFVVDGAPTPDPKARGITRNHRNELVSLISVR